jgi:antitoxin component YwqK of YwqJK toxin-antitoxin module
MKSFRPHVPLRIGIVAALTLSFALSGQTFGQDRAPRGGAPATSQQEAIKIEPYKGPPIFLDEPERVNVESRVVSRETIKEKLGDGRIEREVARFSDDSFAADGAYREFHPNDKPFIEGQFVKGRQEGEWKYYFENGQLNRKVTYKNGKQNGTWEVFRADGTIQAKRGFKDGLRDGEWTTYDATGKQTLTEEHYASGERDGVWKSWYPNGQQKLQVGFKKGKYDGVSIEWDDKGQKRLEAEYSDNKLNGTLTRWLPDGRKIVQKYDNNRLVSESKE